MTAAATRKHEPEQQEKQPQKTHGKAHETPKEAPREKPHEAANDATPLVADEGAHTISDEDVELLRRLGPAAGGVDRARFGVAELLVDDETLTALVTYAPVFMAMGVNVGPALEAIPEALRLEALERHLASSQTLVHRHLAEKVEPIAAISSGVHRVVAASPEGSAIRGAFSMLEKRWNQLYGKGGRSANKSDATPVDPKPPR
jgi:hypothetical protein